MYPEDLKAKSGDRSIKCIFFEHPIWALVCICAVQRQEWSRGGVIAVGGAKAYGLEGCAASRSKDATRGSWPYYSHKLRSLSARILRPYTVLVGAEEFGKNIYVSDMNKNV